MRVVTTLPPSNINQVVFEEQIEEKIYTGFGITFLVLAIIWILIGFAAFITSLVCFGRTGTVLEKIIGLLLAIFFGPFYFIFFFFAGGYCGST
jgi:small neutral amino acid transporter SnatA (MarC family)